MVSFTPVQMYDRECGLLRELRQVTGLTQDEIYLLILPMRLLLLRDGGERGDYDLALTFMDHESDRKNDSSYWDHSERKFFGPLREAMAVAGHFQPEFTSEDVQGSVQQHRLSSQFAFQC